MDREEKIKEIAKKLVELNLVLLTIEELKEILRLLEVMYKAAEGLEAENDKLKKDNAQLLEACKDAIEIAEDDKWTLADRETRIINWKRNVKAAIKAAEGE